MVITCNYQYLRDPALEFRLVPTYRCKHWNCSSVTFECGKTVASNTLLSQQNQSIQTNWSSTPEIASKNMQHDLLVIPENPCFPAHCHGHTAWLALYQFFYIIAWTNLIIGHITKLLVSSFFLSAPIAGSMFKPWPDNIEILSFYSVFIWCSSIQKKFKISQTWFQICPNLLPSAAPSPESARHLRSRSTFAGSDFSSREEGISFAGASEEKETMDFLRQDILKRKALKEVFLDIPWIMDNLHYRQFYTPMSNTFSAKSRNWLTERYSYLHLISFTLW